MVLEETLTEKKRRHINKNMVLTVWDNSLFQTMLVMAVSKGKFGQGHRILSSLFSHGLCSGITNR